MKMFNSRKIVIGNWGLFYSRPFTLEVFYSLIFSSGGKIWKRQDRPPPIPAPCHQVLHILIGACPTCPQLKIFYHAMFDCLENKIIVRRELWIVVLVTLIISTFLSTGKSLWNGHGSPMCYEGRFLKFDYFHFFVHIVPVISITSE